MKRVILLMAALAIPSAEAAYRCVDSKGVTHVGDTPPAACAKIPMQEVSKTGMVLRTIEPTLTPEEAAAREEAENKKREEEKIAAEQKRKDMALLATYASEKEFDVARDRNIEPLQGRIASSKDRQVDLDKRIKAISEEMEFYKAGKGKKAAAKGKDMPPQLTQDMEHSQAEKIRLAKTIVTTEKEIEEIKAKFEADKKRWLVLKGRKTPEAMAAEKAEKAEKAAAEKPAAKKDAKPATK